VRGQHRPSGGKELGITTPPTRIVLALAATLVAGAGAWAEELDEVLVTAPPEAAAPETPPDDPTAFGTVIDASDAATRVETLADLLAETVGVQVRRFGGLGDFSTISVRGFSPGQVQVYLDGVPLSPASNETVNLSDLPLDLVDHVDVYRSGTPAGFAQSALGGVVNVVTRQPPTGQPLWAMAASGESFGTRKTNLAHGATRGPWEYVGFVNYLGSEGDFTFLDDLGTTDNPHDDRETTRENNAFNQVGALSRVRYRTAADATVTLTSDTFWKDEGVPGAGSVQALDTSLETTRQLVHLGLATPGIGDLPVTLEARSWVLYQRVAFDDPEGELVLEPTRSRDQSVASGGQVIAQGALGAHQLVRGAAAIGHETFHSEELETDTSAPDRSRLRGTVVAEDEVLLWGERLSLVPALRWEIVRDQFQRSQVDDYWLPRLGARLQPWPWVALLGNVGRAVRVPNLQELFGTEGVVIGNPNLQAEKARLRDVGVRITPPAWRVLSGAALEVVYFDDPVDDAIVFVQNSQQLIVPENVGKATLRGVESSARARVAERLGVSVNYTYLDARDDSDVPYLNGNQLPGRPRHEFYGRIDFAWSGAHPVRGLGALAPFEPEIFFDANLIADNYLNRANTERVGSRALYGTGVSFGLPGERWAPLRVTFEVRNLTGDQTRDVLGFPLPGRVFSGTVSWGFD
jgi:iron complex outermembrane receptor protein